MNSAQMRNAMKAKVSGSAFSSIKGPGYRHASKAVYMGEGGTYGKMKKTKMRKGR